ncbi:MAG: hypothetical protein JWN14_1004 [Chthonomonadales bacterium]|nr:hypothetical protein [Chthonomonadales bacterium]
MQTHIMRHDLFPDLPQPPGNPSASGPPDLDDAMEEWIRVHEAELQMIEDAECARGCDHFEGNLARNGCPW